MGITGAELDRAIAKFRCQWEDEHPYIEAHTSGSTGTPKHILLPKADMRVSALATCMRFGIDERSTLHLCLSPDYIAGKMVLVRSYVAGCSVFAELPSNRPLSTDPEDDLAISAVVPSQIEGLLMSAYVGRVRNIIVGGAPMTEEQERLLVESGIPSFATYGMTETCSHVALRRVGSRWYEGMPGIGFSTDERGCLVIESPKYSFGRLATNDVVELGSSRSFRWLGRYDNVINSGGIKIHPEEVEARLMGSLDMEFYVSSRPSEKWGEEIVIVVAPRWGGAEIRESDAEILEVCRRLLPPIQVPKGVVRMDRLRRTSNGKIKRG